MNNALKKNGHVIYRSSNFQYINELRCSMECEYVAAFDSLGNIRPLGEVYGEGDE